jgi:RimJ/RimL family protein N-acetyltransferase
MPWASPAAGTPEAQRVRLQDLSTAWDAGREYAFLALSVPDDELLGVFGLHRRVGPGGIELGYGLAEVASGRGHATTGAKALTDVALALPDIERVEVRCDFANVRSQRIPERLGYRLDRIEVDEVEAPAELGQSNGVVL